MKILIVDDEPEIRNLLLDFLTDSGYELETAADGENALKIFQQTNPDLIITDIKMPKMSGIQLLEAVRRQNHDVIVIVMTSFGSEESAIQALELRANNYIRKPMNRKELISLIKKYASIIKERSQELEIIGMFVKRTFSLKLGNDLNLVSKVADRLMLETVDALDPKEKLGVHLGLVELITNAIEHGNLGITFDETTAIVERDGTTAALVRERQKNPRFANRKVTIDFYMDENRCEWLIRDEGDGFNINSIPAYDKKDILSLEHGRGIYLSRLQFDAIEYLGNGNTVRVVKYLTRAKNQAK